MRLDDESESSNVEDRRGEGGGGGRGGLGLGSLVVALLASYFLGVDPSTVLGLISNFSSQAPQVVSPAHKPPANDEMARFVSKVLGSTETTWHAVFREAGSTYREPKLVLFTGATPTACGTGQTAMGTVLLPLRSEGLH